MAQLVLGTAQFGAKYGAMNTVGRLSAGSISEVSDAAMRGGIEIFDTSPYYGDAQHRLGEAFEEGSRPRFVSKFGLDSEDSDMSRMLEQTLQDLQVRTLEALLFHRVDDLRDARAGAACAALRSMRKEGLVGQIGASVYDLTDLEAALELMPDLDIVQLPGNVLDRRLLDHPLLAEFSRRGGTVHVRSAYLQGVLLAPLADVPEKLAALRPSLQVLREVAERHNATLIELLLGYLRHHPLVDAVVVGALTATEMRQTIEAWERSTKLEIEVPSLSDSLLDPRKW